MELKKNYINGEWIPSLSGKTRNVINPADGSVIAQTAEGGVEDAKMAIAAAKESFYGAGEWRRMSAQSRADIILKIADGMDARRDELAKTDTLDNGKPLREAEGDVDDAIHCFRYYAGMIKAPYGGVYDVSDAFGPMHSYTIHE
ncbi:MAG: aldehyde dehydrogenase family protein, partial [Clostridiales bacterium]|nr:aldehyde dehydrogenase family protein [Clostridiales bacterium]